MNLFKFHNPSVSLIKLRRGDMDLYGQIGSIIGIRPLSVGQKTHTHGRMDIIFILLLILKIFLKYFKN